MPQIKMNYIAFWSSELYKLFLIQSCQKIEYNALFIMKFSPVSNFGDQSLLLGYEETFWSKKLGISHASQIWTNEHQILVLS